MSEENPHLLGYNAGSHWLVGVSSLIVIAILALWLASALLDAEEQAEKLEVEMTVRNLRTGLQWAKGDAIIHGRLNEMPAWVGSNPVRWLATTPRGYIGDCPVNGEIDDGIWCFDALRGELLYRPRHVKHLRLKKPAERPLIGWKVVAENTKNSDGLIGLRVQNVTPYEWFAE